MPASTLTTKGQTTIPKEIREHLNLRPGDRIDFVVRPDGSVVVEPVTRDFRMLRGLLRKPGQRRVSVEEMNQAVRRRFARR